MSDNSLLMSILDTNPGIGPDSALSILEKLLMGQARIKNTVLLSGGKENGNSGNTSIGTQQNNAISPVGINPKKAIQQDSVICCECGKSMKMLGDAHLAKHGLNKKTYLEKYGYPSDTALIAISLSDKRKESAKKNKLGHNKSEDTASPSEVPVVAEEATPASNPTQEDTGFTVA